MVDARLPLLQREDWDPVAAEVLAKFDREGREPISLYRVLAHAPRTLRGYAGLAGALRHETSTPRRLHELAILRIAQLTGSAYEWAHHRSFAAAFDIDDRLLGGLDEWRVCELFSAEERLVLRLAEEVHAVAVADDTVTALRDTFGDDGAVELVMVCSAYEMIARVLQAFDIGVEPQYTQYLGTFGNKEVDSDGS
jgi:alkylhydroperoxidase family enzyme